MFKSKQIETYRNNNIWFHKSFKSFKLSFKNKASNHKQADYLLYAKSLASQVLQQFQHGLLKLDFFKTQQQQIYSALRKCNREEKHLIPLQLMKIYNYFHIEIEQNYLNIICESLNYLLTLKSDRDKVVQLLAYERVDVSLKIVLSKGAGGDQKLLGVCSQVLRQMKRLLNNVKQKLTKKQFGIFQKNIRKNSYFLQNYTKKNSPHCIVKRISREKNITEKSDSSQPSDGYLERLEIFLKQSKNQQFQKCLKQIQMSRKASIISRNSKRLNHRRSAKTIKRVSNSWNKQSISIRYKSPRIQKSLSKQTNDLKLEEVFTQIFEDTKKPEYFQKYRSSETQKEKQSRSQLMTEKFYIFTLIKRKLRLIEVKIREIKMINNFIMVNIHFQGHIRQKINLKVEDQCNEIMQNIQQQKFIIFKHCQLKRQGFWMVIKQKLKLSQEKKSAKVSILNDSHINQNQNEFVGFIKIYNVFFFAKMIHKTKLFIYDQHFQKILEQKQLNQCTDIFSYEQKKEKFQQKTLANKTTVKKINKVSVIKQKLKKCEQIQNKIKVILKKTENKPSKTFKNKNAQQWIELSKVNSKNHVIKLKFGKENNLNLQNVGLSGNNCSLAKLDCKIRSNELKSNLFFLKNRFQSLYQHCCSRRKISKLSIRTNQSQIPQIAYEYYFIKLLKSKCFINFRMVILAIQSPLILLDAYIPKFSKVYQFIIDKRLVINFMQNRKQEITTLREMIKVFSKKIKIKIKIRNLAIDKFYIYFQNKQFEGVQVLLRKFNPLRASLGCLETLSLKTNQKIGSSAPIKRQIYKISPKLRNYACQTFLFPLQLFTQFKYLYYELIQKLKESQNTKISDIKIKMYEKSSKDVYKIKRFKQTRKIFLLSGSSKNTLKLQEFELNHKLKRELSFSTDFLANDPFIDKLNGKYLLKYVNRLIKNRPNFKKITVLKK